jgi:TolA-binding protein
MSTVNTGGLQPLRLLGDAGASLLLALAVAGVYLYAPSAADQGDPPKLGSHARSGAVLVPPDDPAAGQGQRAGAVAGAVPETSGQPSTDAPPPPARPTLLAGTRGGVAEQADNASRPSAIAADPFATAPDPFAKDADPFAKDAKPVAKDADPVAENPEPAITGMVPEPPPADPLPKTPRGDLLVAPDVEPPPVASVVETRPVAPAVGGAPVESVPETPETAAAEIMRQAIAAQEQGNLPEARQLYQRVIARYRSTLAATEARTRLPTLDTAEREQRDRAAAEALAEAVEVQETGDLQQAQVRYQAIISRFRGTRAAAAAQSRLATVAVALTNAAAQERQQRATELLEQAKTAREAGEFRAARRTLEQLIQAYPRASATTEAKHLLGIVRTEEGQQNRPRLTHYSDPREDFSPRRPSPRDNLSGKTSGDSTFDREPAPRPRPATDDQRRPVAAPAVQGRSPDHSGAKLTRYGGPDDDEPPASQRGQSAAPSSVGNVGRGASSVGSAKRPAVTLPPPVPDEGLTPQEPRAASVTGPAQRSVEQSQPPKPQSDGSAGPTKKPQVEAAAEPTTKRKVNDAKEPTMKRAPLPSLKSTSRPAPPQGSPKTTE